MKSTKKKMVKRLVGPRENEKILATTSTTQNKVGHDGPSLLRLTKWVRFIKRDFLPTTHYDKKYMVK